MGSYSSVNRYLFLDGLRGLAAVLILAGHCALLVPAGWVAVPFFFVLSGFLAFRGLLGSTDGVTVGVWGVRRILRIVPLYFFYLLVVALVLLIFPMGGGFFRFLPSLIFGYYCWLPFFGVQGLSPWVSQFWTLTLQVQFWLILPFFLLVVRGVWLIRSLLVLVILAPFFRIFLYWWALRGDLNPYDLVYSNPLTYVDAFALGGLVFLLPSWGRFLSGRLFFGFVVVILVFSVILGIFSSSSLFWYFSLGFPWMMMEYYEWVWGYSVLHVGFFLLLRWVISFEGTWVPLVLRPFVWLSPFSYGLYVFHLPVVIVVLLLHGHTDLELGVLFGQVSWAVFVWSFGISLILAILGRKLVEEPFLKLRPDYGR